MVNGVNNPLSHGFQKKNRTQLFGSWIVHIVILCILQSFCFTFKNALIDKDPREKAMSLSTKENNPIHQTCISSGLKPLWITVNDQLSDQAILDGIKYEIGSSIEDVTLLYVDENDIVNDWCEKQNWKSIYSPIITGSEASTIVLYKVNAVAQYIKEFYSRAKLRLIIVQE